MILVEAWKNEKFYNCNDNKMNYEDVNVVAKRKVEIFLNKQNAIKEAEKRAAVWNVLQSLLNISPEKNVYEKIFDIRMQYAEPKEQDNG